MTAFDTVVANVRLEYFHGAGTDPLNYVKILEIGQADKATGIEKGDFLVVDDTFARVVRVVGADVVEIWCNG